MEFSVFETWTVPLSMFALAVSFFLNIREKGMVETKDMYVSGRSVLALMYRIFVSGLMCFFIVTTQMAIRFQLYFYTNQCYLLAFFYFVLISIFDPKMLLNNSFTDRNLKIVYILYSNALCGSFLSTLGYWTFMVKKTTYADSVWKVVWYGGNPHGLSFLLLLIDMVFFHRIPLRFSAVFYVYAYSTFHVLFHMLYHYFSNIWIYPFLNPLTHVGHVIYTAMPIVPYVLHGVFWTISSLRDIVRKRLSYRSGDGVENNEKERSVCDT